MTTSYPSRNAALQKRINDYWNSRARGYSAASEMDLKTNGAKLGEVIDEFINPRGKLKILDVGTGAGFTAIILALQGHEVAAVDPSAEMLARAGANAAAHGVTVNLKLGTADRLPFADHSFDLTLAKDVLWCLKNPFDAYAEMIRVTKPEGYILVQDGNYYLDLFDEDYRQRKEYLELVNGQGTDLHSRTNVDHVDFNIIREIAKELPLSQVRRPAWDTSALIGLGATDIRVRSLENGFAVNTDTGRMMIPSRFIVCAQCPHPPSTPLNELGRKVTRGELPQITQRLQNTGTVNSSQTLRLLADENRIRIIVALGAGELSVSQLCAVTGCTQSLVSHNLRLLRNKCLVTSEKSGRENYYYLTDRGTIDRLFEACRTLTAKAPTQRSL